MLVSNLRLPQKIQHNGKTKQTQLQPSCSASITLSHVVSLGSVWSSTRKPPILCCSISLMVLSIDSILPCCFLGIPSQFKQLKDHHFITIKDDKVIPARDPKQCA
jgi:hypothetical protein